MHAESFLAALDELTPVAAEQWVAAALAEAAALREHDDRLYPNEDDAGGLATAARLHEAWRRWADDADALLKRLRTGGGAVARADELGYAVGRARAMLTVTPERVIEGRRQVREGRTYNAEEVRRELGLPSRR